MTQHQTQIGQILESLADKALFASIPFVALFMAVALIRVG
jgi:phosphatidylglycerophosphate synthase